MSEDSEKTTKPSGVLKRARKVARNKTHRDSPTEVVNEPPAVVETPVAAVSQAETATVGADLAAESPKKNKRRRRKGKGGRSETGESAPAASTPATAESSTHHTANAPSRTRLDPEQLAKFAWKIYLAEISEEGVALIGDNDARELSRRCFRLAEIFLEEQSRRK